MKRRNDIPLGWVCLVVGTVTMCFSLWLFPVYGLLYLIALTIAILALTKEQVFAGVALLLTLLLVPTTLWAFLAIYRGALAVEKGVGFLQKHVDQVTMEGQQARNARAAERDKANWEALHRVDPAFGEWSLALQDADGKPVDGGDGVGGFVRYNGQGIVFVTPLDNSQYQFRVFSIVGDGKRGGWHVDPEGQAGGWFELDSRADLKTADRIDFQWNDNPTAEHAKHGSFRRNWLQPAASKSP